jgi:hypothetical protein
MQIRIQISTFTLPVPFMLIRIQNLVEIFTDKKKSLNKINVTVILTPHIKFSFENLYLNLI